MQPDDPLMMEDGGRVKGDDEVVPSGLSRHPPTFRFRLRSIFLVTTVLCLLLTVLPDVALLLLGYIAAYIALSFAGVAVLIAIHAAFVSICDAAGWLPPRRETHEGSEDEVKGTAEKG